jgi:hypothetical protein
MDGEAGTQAEEETMAKALGRVFFLFDRHRAVWNLLIGIDTRDERQNMQVTGDSQRIVVFYLPRFESVAASISLSSTIATCALPAC